MLTRAGLLGRSRWLLIFLAAALLAPPSASAHVRSGTIAVDYDTRVFSLPAPLQRVIVLCFCTVSSLARALVALTIWSGVAATLLGLVVSEDLLERPEEPAES
jgi:hypothetical protein